MRCPEARADRFRCVSRAALFAMALVPAAAAPAAPGPPEVAVTRPAVRSSAGIRALNGFVENRGQWPDEVLFFARDRGVEATLCRDALVLRPSFDPDARGPWPAPLVLRFPGAAIAVEGEDPLPTKHHFLRASGTAKGALGYARVLYHDVLPGIDVRVRRSQEGFAYDVLVDAGVELSSFVLQVEGAEGVTQEGPGLLSMATAAGRVDQRIGSSWEEDPDGAGRREIASAFRVIGSAAGSAWIGFEAPGRDPAKALVVDPTLVYATYVGGSSQELLRAMDVAPSGEVVLLCRSAFSTPTTPGAFQTTPQGIIEAWVGKLSADGSSLDWGTYLGGTDADDPYGVSVDADGTVVVVGNTWSADFPTTPGTLQPTYTGVPSKNDLFITRLSADGSSLVWSTFYGGPDYEAAMTSALTPRGDVVIAADPFSPSPPATPGAFDTVWDAKDKMLVRISADGTELVFQTYFRTSYIARIVVDAEDDIYFSGLIDVLDAPLPTTAGVLKASLSPGDCGDAFVAKMNGSGHELVWCTYLGGDLLDESAPGLAVDAASAVYVSGLTLSADFPVTAGAFDVTSSNDGGDGYVAKLLPRATGLVWATFLSACCGGSTFQSDLTVDCAGNVISVGRSNEPNFPTTPDAFQPNYIGSFPSPDVHLTKLDGLGESLVYSSYFGGSGGDSSALVGLDQPQDPCLVFATFSTNLPVTPGAYDGTFGGVEDLSVAKFDLELLPWEVLGGGLDGAVDIPNLAGAGTLLPGSMTKLAVRGGKPLAATFAMAGFTRIDAPLLGGTLVPKPDIVLPLMTNATGGIDLAFPWPTVAPGVPLYLQFWIADPGGVFGASATNALKLISQ